MDKLQQKMVAGQKESTALKEGAKKEEVGKGIQGTVNILLQRKTEDKFFRRLQDPDFPLDTFGFEDDDAEEGDEDMDHITSTEDLHKFFEALTLLSEGIRELEEGHGKIVEENDENVALQGQKGLLPAVDVNSLKQEFQKAQDRFCSVIHSSKMPETDKDKENGSSQTGTGKGDEETDSPEETAEKCMEALRSRVTALREALMAEHKKRESVEAKIQEHQKKVDACNDDLSCRKEAGRKVPQAAAAKRVSITSQHKGKGKEGKGLQGKRPSVLFKAPTGADASKGMAGASIRKG
uniref:Uncharacterized protein n=1 Tax=Chromera velia CCMP2878 TaxID=1169474 RepID=A0A0G4I3L0_9ALVE|mmetsp:Transcript_21214/g.42152  ORF Transcript_21214/g.42152 Transcript_21214/m.42152 type:complete len:294 (+) Transcript_21214:263-1144(+)|eukprot:Cvel_10690.t1-p1 / transcript=Cvel_10690.t1 / gene=Cvel_10690 / organism=Chromera_velia_CCMP2878 / gene_product=hypothetical protein / transcript_product=hypothetical protein / location=Cvel_scaffold650:12804-15746(-) / protein_length=293 / sequence_SO=supercontig / SO=protein_coding / is_pseudo=false